MSGLESSCASERLLEAADPAAARLLRALESEDERAAIRAAQIILDRAAFHPTQAVELTGKDGRPIQTAEVEWLEHCTLEEKRAILEIVGRATAHGERRSAANLTGLSTNNASWRSRRPVRTVSQPQHNKAK
jgi:hypothetical protein